MATRPVYPNAVGRLYCLVDNMWRDEGQKRYRDALATYCYCDVRDDGACWHVHADLIVLFRSVHNLATQHVGHPHEYTNEIDRIFNAYVNCGSINEPWNNLRSRFQESHIKTLWLLSERLNLVASCTENLSTNENKELCEKLIADIHSLHGKMLKSDLPIDVKSLLIAQLEGLERQLRQYILHGEVGLKNKASQVLGELAVNYSSIQPCLQHPDYIATVSLYMKVCNLIQTAAGLAQIGQVIFPLLS